VAQHAKLIACITLRARIAIANLLSQARISVPSCLEKSKFAAICKPPIPLGLKTEACNGMRDLAQSAQALSTLTHEERLRFYLVAALGLQMR
jgi:hypothetical protein